MRIIPFIAVLGILISIAVLIAVIIKAGRGSGKQDPKDKA